MPKSTSKRGLVLVTGGSGYIAGYCVAQLLNDGWGVRTTVRSVAKTKAVRASIGNISTKASELEFVQGDVEKRARDAPQRLLERRLVERDRDVRFVGRRSVGDVDHGSGPGEQRLERRANAVDERFAVEIDRFDRGEGLAALAVLSEHAPSRRRRNRDRFHTHAAKDLV